MAVKSFVIEGGITLAYFSGEDQTRHVLVQTADDDAAVVTADGSVPQELMTQERLESYIARQLDFPNQTEFDAVYKRLADLRAQGLRPAADEPDITRDNMKLRITVEVL